MRKDKKIMRVNYRMRQNNVQGLPILYVRVSCKHFYIQLSSENGILFDISSVNQKNIKGYNTTGVLRLADICANKMNEMNVTEFVFNRGDKRFVGKIKIFCDTLKEKLGGKHGK